MQRIILHIDMDYFYAQIEERENPRFCGKPVVVGADPKGGKGRGVVSAANYVSRKYGIHSAQPISIAWQKCPKAIFLPVNMQLYQKVSERIMEIVTKFSKTWEMISLDEAYLDLSFLKDFEQARELAKKLKAEILQKEKITSTIGIGPNKLIAKMATNKAKPDGLLIIKSDQVEKFLENMNVREIPGIGPKTAERLKALNVQTIKQLKKIPKAKLKEMFGIVGENIWEKARGIDEGEVTADEPVKSIGKEHTFEKDTRDPELLFKFFNRIIKDVWQETTDSGFSFKTVTVVCRFSGFETHTKSKTLKTESKDYETLKDLAKKLLLKFIMENPKPIRLIGLRLKVA